MSSTERGRPLLPPPFRINHACTDTRGAQRQAILRQQVRDLYYFQWRKAAGCAESVEPASSVSRPLGDNDAVDVRAFGSWSPLLDQGHDFNAF